jgi:hypothetical protein
VLWEPPFSGASIEFFGIIGAFKCPESPATCWLRDRHLMKFFALIVTVRRRESALRGIGAHDNVLVALLSIPLILAHPLG